MKHIVLFLLCVFVIHNAFADIETMQWYVDGSVYDTTTCQSGGNVVPPTAPEKPGYTFVGWVVGLKDFSTLDTSINGDSYTTRGTGESSASYNQRGEWSVVFSYGTVSGQSLCSPTTGTANTPGVPQEKASLADWKNCWCRVTSYTTNDGIVYEPIDSPMSWVYQSNMGHYTACSPTCRAYCPEWLRTNKNFRRALFGITQ